MESKANNVPWESFRRDAHDAFDNVEFDNTEPSVALVTAEAEMKRLADKEQLAQKQLDAANLMLKDMHERRDALAKKLRVAKEKSQEANSTCGRQTVILGNLKQYFRGVLADLFTISKPWERPQKEPGSPKTRSTVRYWIMIMIAYAIDPTPLTKTQLEKVLKISAKNKAFGYALQDMCFMQVLVRYGGARSQYQLHPDVIDAMGCKYVAAASVVNVSDVLDSFSLGNKDPDDSDHEP